jgi:hypothetical protein
MLVRRFHWTLGRLDTWVLLGCFLDAQLNAFSCLMLLVLMTLIAPMLIGRSGALRQGACFFHHNDARSTTHFDI